jgi:hypothetical protein
MDFYFRSLQKRIGKPLLRQKEAGQIVVEYILMLTVAVAAALLIVKTMVNMDPQNPGFLISTWTGLVQAISTDVADDAKGP